MSRRVVVSGSFVAILSLCIGFPAARSAGTPPLTLEEAVAALGDSPRAALDLVRGRLAYRPYRGFVKGPEAAWADGTANAADAADLLREILVRKGIEARVALGTLDAESAASLLAKILPAAPPAPEVGAALPGEETADPPSDPALLDIVSAFAWVQIREGEDWADLFPFAPAAGDAAPVAGEVLDEVVAERRRRVRFEVFARAREEEEPRRILEYEAPAGSLVGKTIAFANLGVDEGDRGHRAEPGRLTPALWVDGVLVTGAPYGISMPAGVPGGFGKLFGGGEDEAPAKDAGSAALEEAWIDLTLLGGEGPDRHERRYLLLPGEPGLDRLDDFTAFCVAFGSPPSAGVRRAAAAAAAAAKPKEGTALPTSGEITPEMIERAKDLFARTAGVAGALAFRLAADTGRLLPELDLAYGTVSDYEDARLVSVSLDGRAGRMSTDLVFDSVRAFARRGTKVSAPAALVALRGLIAADVEAGLLSSFATRSKTAGPPLTVSGVFAAARKAGVKAVLVAAENADALDGVTLPSGARRILGERIEAGRIVVIPAKPVEVAGAPATAWIEMDRETGEWRGVFPDGRHQATAEEGALQGSSGPFASFAFAFIGGFSGTLWSFASNVLGMVDESDADMRVVFRLAIAAAAAVDWNSVVIEAWGDAASAVLFGGGPADLAMGQLAMFLGQATAIHFLWTRFQ